LQVLPGKGVVDNAIAGGALPDLSLTIHVKQTFAALIRSKWQSKAA